MIDSSMAVPTDNYILARDTSEAERLNVQHEYMISCQGYYLHPDIQIPTTQARIADVCTGTAIFLRDLAPAYSSAECHGFDISDKMFPAPADLGPNIELHVADIKQPFERCWIGYFDVVHVRLIEAAMRKEDWAPALRNLTTLLKPGGWLQWVEDDRAHSVRHAARPVAPPNAAKESLLSPPGSSTGFLPPRISFLDRFNQAIMPNERADDMTYGYMNLDSLMKDPSCGDLEKVGCDMYVIDREDDGGKLRRDWAAMGISAVWSMLKSREEVGDRLTDLSRDELAEGFMKDIAVGGHFITRATVFTGRKKA
nr:n-methyltransferase sirn [Quercus suber]